MPERKTSNPPTSVNDARFVSSSTGIRGCPEPVLPEHAFIGRSNVGKSSLINMITGRKNLAKTSSTPGKTRLINHFIINNSWFIADLPGYGYARVSKSDREKWPEMIRNFLLKRKNLLNTFILVDIRLEPQPADLAFIRWMGENNLPFSIVFTKCDKISKAKIKSATARYQKALAEEWEEMPLFFYTSSANSTGRDEILEYIHGTNPVFKTSEISPKHN